MTTNNKGYVMFNTSEWSCTDPDNFQFCRTINPHTFGYIQLTDCAAMRLQKELGQRLNNKHLLEVLNGKTILRDWHWDDIDITDYDEDEIKEYLAPYGKGYLTDIKGQDRNQLIAEAIFEDYVLSNIV